MSSGTPMVSEKDVRHAWYVVDATDQVLGRLATRVAKVLSGKHRANWVPYLDTGDFVVVTNAEKVRLTGKKTDDKIYHRHTGYPGGLKSISVKDLQVKYPERVIEAAIRGMLPHTKLGRKQFKKLKVYKGGSHPHEAQQPKTLQVSPARKAS
ncbi:MAG: 50S ribosomal protein L13 [Acidobacteria bacterium]|nr:50S ribosomal protein L13 [Acidobacteriota bacterium]MCA1610282.1 50S ribosomal protein L13 [Acidobacteriota bacterium]